MQDVQLEPEVRTRGKVLAELTTEHVAIKNGKWNSDLWSAKTPSEP